MAITLCRVGLRRKVHHCVSGPARLYRLPGLCLLVLLTLTLVLVVLRWKHSAHSGTRLGEIKDGSLNVELPEYAQWDSSALHRLHGRALGAADQLVQLQGDTTSLSVEELTRELTRRLNQKSSNRRVVYHNAQPCRNETDFSACVGPCRYSLSSTSIETVKKITQHPGLTLGPHQRRAILSLGDGIPDSDVIIVSAVSSNHYPEMQAMFESLHKTVYPALEERIETSRRYPNRLQQRTKASGLDSNPRQLLGQVAIESFTVVLYDIGLTSGERRMTEKNCRCQVITFPKHLFPVHVYDKLCYSWKPLVVMAASHHARKLVVWQDTSVRWFSGFLDSLDRAFTSGHQLLRYLDSDRVPAVTVDETFEYMQEKPCSFLSYPEIQANLHIHRVDRFNRQMVFEPWARCALEKQCMCPRPPVTVLVWGYGTPGHCHRFDQSAFSILLSRIYQEKLYKVMFQAFVFSQEQKFRVSRGHSNKYYFKP